MIKSPQKNVANRWGSNPQLPDHQSDTHLTEPPRRANKVKEYIWKKKLPLICKGKQLQHTLCWFLIVLGFNDTSTLVGHFVSSPREREKNIEEIVEEMKEGQGRKRNRNESEETEEINAFPLYPWIAGLAQLEANISWTPQWRKILLTFATPNHPLIVLGFN